jgi:hypothetical protein
MRHVARSTQNLVHFIHLDQGVRGGLFIGEIKGLITLSELSLTNHYIPKVHSLRGITDHYCS